MSAVTDRAGKGEGKHRGWCGGCRTGNGGRHLGIGFHGACLILHQIRDVTDYCTDLVGIYTIPTVAIFYLLGYILSPNKN